jgi:hypothetical protein
MQAAALTRLEWNPIGRAEGGAAGQRRQKGGRRDLPQGGLVRVLNRLADLPGAAGDERNRNVSPIKHPRAPSLRRPRSWPVRSADRDLAQATRIDVQWSSAFAYVVEVASLCNRRGVAARVAGDSSNNTQAEVTGANSTSGSGVNDIGGPRGEGSRRENPAYMDAGRPIPGKPR